MPLKARIRIYINLLAIYVAILFARMYLLIGDKNKAITILKNCAKTCVNNYPGTYTLKRLENLLTEIAEENIPEAEHKDKPVASSGNRKLNIVHVITEGYDIGGHLRLIINWITADCDNRHTIIFTNSESGIPQIVYALQEKIPSLRILKLTGRRSDIEASMELRNHYVGYDFIILHHHPYDVVAFMSCVSKNIPPVAILNHADHTFWIGAAIADALISIRTDKLWAGVRQRQIAKVFQLPIPVSEFMDHSYLQARQSLGISGNHVVLLTIASAYKLKPNQHYNFYSEMIELINEFPNVLVYIVGVEDQTNWSEKWSHERMKLCRAMPDVSIFEAACDIYVESFPFPSFTSILQVAAKNKALQLIYKPERVGMIFHTDIPELQYPGSKEEWRLQLKRLITEKAYREHVKNVQFNYVSQIHVIEKGWPGKLKIIYDEMLSSRHGYRRLKSNNWTMTGSEEVVLNQMSSGICLYDLIPAKNPFLAIVIKVLSNLFKIMRLAVVS